MIFKKKTHLAYGNYAAFVGKHFKNSIFFGHCDRGGKKISVNNRQMTEKKTSISMSSCRVDVNVLFSLPPLKKTKIFLFFPPLRIEDAPLYEHALFQQQNFISANALFLDKIKKLDLKTRRN